MVVLKKIKSATLVEVIVATVLIVIIYGIASLILNNLIVNSVAKNTHAIENKLNELEYAYQNNLIQLPFNEAFQNWEISIQLEKENSQKIIRLRAVKHNHNKTIERNLIDVAN